MILTFLIAYNLVIFSSNGIQNDLFCRFPHGKYEYSKNTPRSVFFIYFISIFDIVYCHPNFVLFCHLSHESYYDYFILIKHSLQQN